MSRSGVCQILCVILLFVFIAFYFSEESETIKTSAEIAETVTEVIDTEGLQLFDGTRFADEFSLSTDGFTDFVYYGSEDIMNPDEIIIIRVGEGIDPSEIQSVMEKRAEDKYNTFKDYDPVAAELLKNRVIYRKNNVIFYAVDKNASVALEAFIDSVE